MLNKLNKWIVYHILTSNKQKAQDIYIMRQKEYHRKLLEQQTYKYLRNR